ncbi:MAG: ATP-binding protein [Planctomycetota bacterium]|nr:ATP-binding protein [Planctomycetota bacterium]
MRTNIHRTLLLLILAVLVPVLGLLVFTFVDQFQKAFNDEIKDTLERARDNGAVFEFYMRDLSRQELAVGIALMSLQPYTKEAANQYLALAAADYTSVRWMCWLDPGGTVIASSRPADIGKNLGQDACFREILKAPGLPYAVSDLLPGESTEEPEFVIARGILDKEGKTRGVIMTRLGTESIGASALLTDRPDRGRFTLFDRKGFLAYHFPKLPVAPEQRLWRSKDPHLDKALAGEEGSGAFVSPLDGTKLIATRVPLKDSGWVAGASRPYSDVMHSVYRSLAIDLAVMLGIVAVSVLLSVVVTRRVTRPIRRLQAQAAAIGKGDLDCRTDITGITEFEELSGALNRMAASLKLAMEEAERRAAENLSLAKFPAENPSPVCRFSAEGFIIYANAASAPLLGAWNCRVGHQAPSSIRQAMTQAMTSGKPNEFDAVVGDRTFSLVVSPAIEAGYANVYGRDVTERRKAQEALSRINAELEQRVEQRTAALRAASAYARSLIEASLDPLVTISPEGKITDVNLATEEVTGVARTRLVGTDFSDYFTEPDRARAGYHAVLDRGLVLDYPLAIRHTSGRITDVLYNATVYRNEAGEIQGVFAAARDVTARKKAEEELARHREHLEELVKQRTGELARSNQDLEQFAYVASHDLQEPLRIVTGYIQLLERRYKDRLDKDANDFIAFAVDGVTRMQRLIQDLLTYSRLGTRGHEMTQTDCEKALSSALANLRLAINESGAVITHEALPTLTADEPQLIQLLQNLIGNAIKFKGGRRPEIHISACPADGRTLFAVQDNGIGIDVPYLERIFIIFQRLHGQQEYPGTGIGLALCKRIVERHGGRIWVESKVGEGSIFYFTL